MSEGTLFRVFFEKAFFAFSWTEKETKKIQKGKKTPSETTRQSKRRLLIVDAKTKNNY
tara:strand:+ start:620 stop:793 length:174 start_codon:yes stop_codon:yes gene_type:complete